MGETIRWSGMALLFLMGSSSCSTHGIKEESGFTYKNLTIAKGLCQGRQRRDYQFSRQASKLEVEKAFMTGQPLRSVQVSQKDLSTIDLLDTKGTIRIINVVPSLDTKVCEQQTHYLSEKNQGLDQKVTLITISVDTPFAQNRFAQEAHINNVLFLSDYRGGQFGETYGLLLVEPHLLARAILVVDQNNTVQYLQITP